MAAPTAGSTGPATFGHWWTKSRTRGVRFKLVGFALRQYREAMCQFRDSLGLTCEEEEVVWYHEGLPDEETISRSFDSLSRY